MLQLAVPVESVVPEQFCADEPVPRVKVTVRPAMGVAGVGSSVVSTPETARGCPFWAVTAPV